MIEVTSREQLEKIVADNNSVVVNFAAPAWCIPCLRFTPHYKIASDKSDATFVHVDVDSNEWAMVDYGIKSVPTVILIEKGQYAKHLKGRTALALLKELE